INGEQLSRWAEGIWSALPSITLNEAEFSFATNSTANALDCVVDIASSDLEILLKSFPASCRPFSAQLLLSKVKVLQELNHELEKNNITSPFTKTSLLEPVFLSNIIVATKRSWDVVEAQGIKSGEKIFIWLREHLSKNYVRGALASVTS